MRRHSRLVLGAWLVSCLFLTGSPAEVGVGKKPPPLSAARWFNTPGPLSLEGLEGKVVLLDFWGVWCTPCREEMPKLVALHRDFAARGLVVLAIHTPLKADLVEGYLKEHRIPLAVAVDTGDTAEAYGVAEFPTYVVIDRGGLVLSRPEHPPDRDTIVRLLADDSRGK